MIKLLRSNLLRLFKSKAFYAVLAVQAGIILLLTVNSCLAALSPEADVRPDAVFKYTACSMAEAVLLSVICSLFTGADYSNGTIRNKLIIGHTRTQVYLANLITVITAGLCMNVSAMLVFYPVTVPLLGEFAGNAQTLLKVFFLGILVMLVYASLFTAVSMTVKSAVASLIITVGAIIVMSLLSTYFIARIDDPLTYTQVTVNEFGEMITEIVPNPFRKSDGVLAFFKVLLNLFPSGQTAVIGTDKSVGWLSAVSSVCLFCVSAGVGLAVFGRQNLK